MEWKQDLLGEVAAFDFVQRPGLRAQCLPAISSRRCDLDNILMPNPHRHPAAHILWWHLGFARVTFPGGLLEGLCALLLNPESTGGWQLNSPLRQGPAGRSGYTWGVMTGGLLRLRLDPA